MGGGQLITNLKKKQKNKKPKFYIAKKVVCIAKPFAKI